MSIVIKGMEMPKNCGECKFCRMTYTQYGEIFSADCTIKDFPIKWSELDLRDGLCPLIELPPHGRLIDADDFFRSFPELIPYEFATPTILEAEESET